MLWALLLPTIIMVTLVLVKRFNQKTRGHKFWNFILWTMYYLLQFFKFIYPRNACCLDQTCRHLCTPLFIAAWLTASGVRNWGSSNCPASPLLGGWSRVIHVQSSAPGDTCSLLRHIEIWEGAHMFSCQMLCAKCFQKERGKFVKTKCPFHLEVENGNGIEGESYHFLRITTQVLCIPYLI